MGGCSGGRQCCCRVEVESSVGLEGISELLRLNIFDGRWLGFGTNKDLL